MVEQIQYGMVGGGLDAFIGEVHRKGLAFDTRCRIAAGCFSSRQEQNEKTASAYGIAPERIYGTYQEMAEAEGKRADGIRFVSIVTPNALHFAVAKAFLEAGIHVVCEKPLCFTVAEAETLKRLSEEKNLLFATTYAYTGYTMVKVMKEMIANQTIGNILSINAEYVQEWLLDEVSDAQSTKSLSVWRMDPEHSGIANCVGDIGTHIENMVHYVTGLKIKRLLATTNHFGQPLDLNANIILEYENGCNGAYWCSQIAAGRLNGLIIRIYGDKGALEWEQHFPDYVKYTPKGQPTQILSRGTGYIQEKSGGLSRIPSGHPEGYYIGFANTYRNFVNALLQKEQGEPFAPEQVAYPTVEDGLNGVKFVQAVVQSAKNGSAWVTL